MFMAMFVDFSGYFSTLMDIYICGISINFYVTWGDVVISTEISISKL